MSIIDIVVLRHSRRSRIIVRMDSHHNALEPSSLVMKIRVLLEGVILPCIALVGIIGENRRKLGGRLKNSYPKIHLLIPSMITTLVYF